MSVRLNNNLAASSIRRDLKSAEAGMNEAVRQLSSGARINSAADDAAGIAISTHIQANRRGLGQALRNANDGISMTQTVEGSTTEISNMLMRLRELSVQAASDTLGDGERQLADKEFQHILHEVDRMAASSQFNGRNLVDGSTSEVGVQVGSYAGAENSISVGAGINLTTSGLGISSLSINNRDAAANNLGALDGAIRNVGSARATLGAAQNRMQSTINNLEVSGVNADSTYSRIHDADLALTTANFLRSDALSKTSTAVLVQSNGLTKDALKLI